MKVILPENIAEITLNQFLKLEDLNTRDLDINNYNKRKLSIFTNIPFNQIGNVRSEDAERLLTQIDKALATEVEFTPTFTMHEIEFGFIPNFDKITFDENRALMEYGVDKNTLHNLMAILFRPITKKEGDKYEIMGFNDSEQYAELMKDMPLNCVNGALVFFWSLANELQQATQKYLTEELVRGMKPKSTSRILDGIRHIKNWLKTTSLKSRKLAV